MDVHLPSISVLIPTLNSERTLTMCLEAIRAQDYPVKLIEIIVADGGSKDRTREIAQNYQANVVENPLVTGEAGKACALRAASGELVALIDSDNVLMGTDWLRRMIVPFADPEVVGSEPLKFVAARDDTIIDRYCALAGVNDPLCLFIGNFDRESAISGTWTNLPVRAEDRGAYILIDLSEPCLPTFGANGTLYRREALQPLVGDYLMDIDIPGQLGETGANRRFAKVKVGIRHLYCSGIRAFLRKQQRRIRDVLSAKKFAGERTYPWDRMLWAGSFRLIISCLTVIPLCVQAARAYRRSRDTAAFFHPIACWATLAIYGYNFVFARGRVLSRDGWRQ